MLTAAVGENWCTPDGVALETYAGREEPPAACARPTLQRFCNGIAEPADLMLGSKQLRIKTDSVERLTGRSRETARSL